MTDVTTNMSPEWIAQALKANPCVLMADGNIRLCPARLSFPHLFEKQPPMEASGVAKYAASFLFPEGADLTVLKEAATHYPPPR